MYERKVGYYFIVMASIIIVLAGVKSASDILVPFLLSLFIAIILSPMFQFLQRKKFPDSLALIVVILGFVVFLVLIASLIGTSVQDFSANINTYTLKLNAYYDNLAQYAAHFGFNIPLDEIRAMFNTQQLMLFTSSLVKSMSSMFTNSFVILLTVAFMLLESKTFSRKIDFADGDKDTIVHINSILDKIKEYMMLKALISLLTGAVVWIALVLIGTDYAFLWAVFAFLLNFIPNIGSIIAAVPAVIITLVQLGSFSALLVASLYVAINVVIGSIIEPKIMGKGLGLSTLVVFLSLLFWGWLLGMVGMLLSIPLTIMAKIILNENENSRWVSVLLGSGDNLQSEK
jgi:predicted PurR-regulated permease PerM